jgi:predicted ATPase
MLVGQDRARVSQPARYAPLGLPSRASQMVGRDGERRMVVASLEGVVPAVVSITGVAGSGKSTLAAASAESLAEQRSWQVSWVDVTSEPAGTSLSLTLQQCLGIDDLERSTLRLATFGRRMLVVLDGADGRLHELAEAVAPLEDCPAVRVVLTSIRGINGPNVLAVPIGGLEVPPTEACGGELAKYPSIELFVSVATAVNPELVGDEQMLSEAARVCRALDGLPLAVKLAAGRLGRPLSTAARMSRHVQVDPTFGLMLSEVEPDAGSRVHQGSVRAALDWTYSQLDPTQQHVLRRTCVFGGPFGLEAAEQVCEISRYKVAQPLAELAAIRLLEMRADEAAEIQFETHPLVRAFGAEALAASGEAPHAADLHAALVSRWARRASCLYDQCQPEADIQLITAEPDLYSALDYLIETNRKAEALRLAADFGHVTAEAGHNRDLVARLDDLLADCPSEADSGTVASALLWASELGLQAVSGPDTVECSRGRWREGMALARVEGEPHLLLRGLASAVRALPVTGDFIAAKEAAEEGLSLAAEIGHAPWLARFTAWSGMIAHQERDFAAAAQLATEGLGIALRSSDRRALVLIGLLVSGMPEEHAPKLAMLPPLEDLYDMAVDLGDRHSQSWLLAQLATYAARRGDSQSAASLILRRVAFVRSSSSLVMGPSLMTSVRVLAQLGHPKLAARVHGSLAAMMPVLFAAMGAREQSSGSDNLSRLKADLGSDVFEEQVRAGACDTWADALLTILPVLGEAASNVSRGALISPGGRMRFSGS